MQTVDELIRGLRQIDEQVTDEILHDLIEEHAPVRKRMIDLYNRYKANEEGVPIFSREVPDYEKVNNRINNDFFSEIIDTKVGYMFGNPISYNVDIEAPNAEEADKAIKRFNLRNNVEDLDSETGKMAAICGMGARLLYIDKEGEERVMNVNPWECIFIADRSLDEPQYAMRYYPVTVQRDGRKEHRIRVEWYDQKNITYFIEDENGIFVLDDTEERNPQPHMFDFIPLIEFPNNAERQGDAEKVLPLIDAYDRTLSDVNSEIESFRLAYMVFYGMEPDEETIRKAQQTGAFGAGDPGEGKIEFLTKQLDDAIIEHHLDRLEANIMRFSKSVNFTDEQFAGNLSGVAIRFKLMALENKSIMTERKFTAALRRQFKVLASAWRKKGILLDYENVWFQFKRNVPINLLDEAQTTAALRGHVSERTRLGLLSFVDDVEWEIEQMEKEKEVDLGGVIDGSGEGAEEGGRDSEEETGEAGEGID